MPLYSKAEYDEDIAAIEKLEHKATEKLVAGKLNGFKFNQVRDQLDKLRESLTGKLRITGLMLAENRAVERETKNCTITGHKRRHPCCAVCRPKKKRV